MSRIGELIKCCNQIQTPHSDVSQGKLDAMRETLKLFSSAGPVTDIGFVDAYGPLYQELGFEVQACNLPEYDLHEFHEPGTERVIARHVLEHSLVPAAKYLRQSGRSW